MSSRRTLLFLAVLVLVHAVFARRIKPRPSAEAPSARQTKTTMEEVEDGIKADDKHEAKPRPAKGNSALQSNLKALHAQEGFKSDDKQDEAQPAKGNSAL